MAGQAPPALKCKQTEAVGAGGSGEAAGAGLLRDANLSRSAADAPVPNATSSMRSPRVLLPRRFSSLNCRGLVGLLACLAFSAPGSAVAASDDLAADVRRLVAQLDYSELAARERAEEQLVKLGPAALPFLPSPTDRMPAETAERLSRVRMRWNKPVLREPLPLRL